MVKINRSRSPNRTLILYNGLNYPPVRRSGKGKLCRLSSGSEMLS
jgi:hypothetical protein